MAEREASDNGAKTAHDVLQMSGKDELKFGVLIGLIKVGQVSNSDVIDTVLNLVSLQSHLEILDAYNCFNLMARNGVLAACPVRIALPVNWLPVCHCLRLLQRPAPTCPEAEAACGRGCQRSPSIVTSRIIR